MDGLRDRKRDATRRALAETAFELAGKRGLDGFTISDVVEQAGYARRTFANHFACKEAAIAEIVRSGSADLTTAISGLPVGAAVTELIDAVVTAVLDPRRLATYRGLLAMADAEPTLRLWVDAAFRDLLGSATEALLDRDDLGLDPVDARLLLGALDGMIGSALGGDPSTMVDLDSPTALTAFRATISARLSRGFAAVQRDQR